MSLPRAALTVLQSLAYQLASTPPNKTPSKGRFDASHPWWIRIAPAVMQIHTPVIWLCASAEVALALATHSSSPLPPSLSRFIQHTLCPFPLAPDSTPNSSVSWSLALGTILTTLGAAVRLSCFRTLGHLFTFDLAILPKHTLVTSGPYKWVRHPAYAGSLMMILGLGLVHLVGGSQSALEGGGWVEDGGWATSCVVPTVLHTLNVSDVRTTGALVRTLFAALWLAWWVAVGTLRCRAEDRELKKQFGKEWDGYAGQVRWWYLPGII